MRGVTACLLIVMGSALAGCLTSDPDPTPEVEDLVPAVEPVDWITLDADGAIVVHGTGGLLVPIEVPERVRAARVGWTGSSDSTWMVLPVARPSDACTEQDPVFFIDGHTSARDWGYIEAGRYLLLGHMRDGSSFTMIFGDGATVEVHEPLPVQAESGPIDPRRVLEAGRFGWEWGPVPTGDAVGFAFAATDWGSVVSDLAENHVSIGTEAGPCAEAVRPDPSGASGQPIAFTALNGTLAAYAVGHIDGYANLVQPPEVVAGHVSIPHELWERLLLP